MLLLGACLLFLQIAAVHPAPCPAQDRPPRPRPTLLRASASAIRFLWPLRAARRLTPLSTLPLSPWTWRALRTPLLWLLKSPWLPIIRQTTTRSLALSPLPVLPAHRGCQRQLPSLLTIPLCERPAQPWRSFRWAGWRDTASQARCPSCWSSGRAAARRAPAPWRLSLPMVPTSSLTLRSQWRCGWTAPRAPPVLRPWQRSETGQSRSRSHVLRRGQSLWDQPHRSVSVPRLTLLQPQPERVTWESCDESFLHLWLLVCLCFCSAAPPSHYSQAAWGVETKKELWLWHFSIRGEVKKRQNAQISAILLVTGLRSCGRKTSFWSFVLF